MKILIGFLIFLLVSVTQTFAADVIVLPADLLNPKENYYGFDEVSEIVANDIIKIFNQSNGKIQTPDLYEIRNKLNQNDQLKQTTLQTLEKYKNTNKLDFENLKTIGDNFSTKYILLIMSSAVTNKNSIKRSVWEVLEISTVFNILYPYRLETSVILLDTSNNSIMWSNNYSTKLGSNNNVFAAKNYVQAADEYEKIKLYSKTVTAPAASQNIILRFYPKSIRPIEKEVNENSGGALRFEKNLPEKPQQYKPRDNFYGDMIYGI